MILPMMGLLFTLFAGGVSCAVILGVVAAWRWLVPFTLTPHPGRRWCRGVVPGFGTAVAWVASG